MRLQDEEGRLLACVLDMSLESLRQKVVFQNSIDVWIALAGEKSVGWNDVDGYKRFVAYLLENGLSLKAFTLCAHEAGATEQEKTEFVERLAGQKEADPNAATYTIRLTDAAIQTIRGFEP